MPAAFVPSLRTPLVLAWQRAIHDGFTIFIVGGLLKAAVAGALTPAAWRLVRQVEARR